MIQNTILQHKDEKEKFLAKKYIAREKLGTIAQFLDKDIIKVISGPRRAGKSVFCMLLLKNKQFAYLNFDDENLLKVNNYDKLLEALFEIYPGSEFIFFDEIQNMDKWELFVNKLHRRGFNIILTGSNSQLLGKELASTLTGRYILLETFPFSFREFLQAKGFKGSQSGMNIPENKGECLSYLYEYTNTGGFPEVVVKGLEPRVYLETLFDAVLLKDVVKRYNIRFVQQFYNLATYIVSNFSSEFSFTKLRNILGMRSTNTVEKYLRYLEESYLIFSLNRFSFKIKEQIKAPRKIYLVDNGIALAKSFQISGNTGKLMENLVFVELLRRGYICNRTLFYYKTDNQLEVDAYSGESSTCFR